MMETTLFTIDLGNSFPNIGLWENDKLIAIHALEKFKNNNQTPVAASIVANKKKLTPFNSQLIELPLISEGHFLDMPTLYSKELGQDRLYQIYYLYKNLLTNDTKEIWLVDAGTFITIDKITLDGHQGGFIYPGLKLFSQCYQKGEQLNPPLTMGDLIKTLPCTTVEAIEQATLNYLSKLIPKKIGQIVLSGGQANLLKTFYPNAIIHSDLIHYALQYLSTKAFHGKK